MCRINALTSKNIDSFILTPCSYCKFSTTVSTAIFSYVQATQPEKLNLVLDMRTPDPGLGEYMKVGLRGLAF